ncbi:glucose-6-phosphate dehydrogenase [Petrocella sp. FN5]|uniref:glucose-6-phosphate dehydrogenase n=1 Tax=Petrocella sp. FN5 TaxID=3032002 RepID=UPI0023D98D20|nr:glucose-6-phosphate dehydrogenase [Petrocella sp. FN5]MDF1616521.1 glucose-6-phosphate dehydrogenase [Petrocella sp. FN5]
MENQKVIFTIFGGTGNLTYYKLMPAFYQLFLGGRLLNDMTIIVLGRKDKDTSMYREEVKDVLMKKVSNFNESVFVAFSAMLQYYQMNFEKAEDYTEFNTYMQSQNCPNRIFYLATAPTFFPLISEQLRDKKLLDVKGYVRAVFEKPFGYDLESAEKINDIISDIFGEDYIYRIDHYLGKEMIQNINTVRFSNQIFSAVWNKDSIDNVQITVKEKDGVKDRGGYYDQAGALRDMVQNHLIQILALVAMEPPKRLDNQSIKEEKVKVIQNLNVQMDLESHNGLIFGQYEGYREEVKVDPNSNTETFVAMKCFVNRPRWEGVPFYLRTGKALDGGEAKIVIEFRVDGFDTPSNTERIPNLLVIKIQPDEGVYLRINTKEPRSESNLMSVNLSYCQSCDIFYKSPDAYERLLLDIINGDTAMFTGWEEVKSAWELISEVIDKCPTKSPYLDTYPKGSDGPMSAHNMLKMDGRHWWRLDDLNNDFD